MNDTYLTVVGNIVDEPTLRHTATGQEVLSFRMASTSRRHDREQNRWIDNQKLYVSVTCWQRLAANGEVSLRKGQPVMVYGRYFIKEYVKDETTRIAYELHADAVGHNLSWGTSAFTKLTRRSAMTVVDAGPDGLPAEYVDDAVPEPGEATPALVGVG